MSASRQFDQSPARYFVQSQGRQRNRVLVGGNYGASMKVTGAQRTGGYRGFLTGNDTLYRQAEWEVTGVQVTQPEPGGPYVYLPRSYREISKIHDLIGDAYFWELWLGEGAEGQPVAELLASWWYVQDNDPNTNPNIPGNSIIGNNPVYPTWGISYPPSDGYGFVVFFGIVSDTEYLLHRRYDNGEIVYDYYERLILKNPGPVASFGGAVALMDAFDYHCDRLYTLPLNTGDLPIHTGLGASPFASHVTMQYRRTTEGVQLYPALPGDVLETGGMAGSNCVGGGASLMAPPLGGALTFGIAGWPVCLYYSVSKVKMAAGQPEINIVKCNRLPCDWGDATGVDCAAQLAAEPLGGPHNIFTAMPAVSNCEPCAGATVPLQSRCLYGAEFRPTDTFVRGYLYVQRPPLAQILGQAYADINGNGKPDDIINVNGVVLLAPLRYVKIVITTATGRVFQFRTSERGGINFTFPPNVFGHMTLEIDRTEEVYNYQVGTAAQNSQADIIYDDGTVTTTVADPLPMNLIVYPRRPISTQVVIGMKPVGEYKFWFGFPPPL